MTFLKDLIPGIGDISWAPSFLRGPRPKSVTELCELMLTSDGEYSSLVLADEVLNSYHELSEGEQLVFLRYLSNDLDVDRKALRQTATAYCETSSVENFSRLNAVLRTPRKRVLQLLNQIPEGTRRLVTMREQALKLKREHPEIEKTSLELLGLFENWFNRGFLELRQIDWTTPAHILEKIIAYEAVHRIDNWRELRARLEPQDRFCFAFFHPSMSDEPLVFVEVALTLGIPNQIDQLLSTDREQTPVQSADSAIFYSISNCHAGLAGVSFGNFLIKQVATKLQQEFPQLKKFATLSPAPKFKNWLEPKLELEGRDVADADLNHEAACYYLQAKNKDGFPLDPVARFHLRNGARLERINLNADNSVKGQTQSYGMMVNYVYDLNRVVENHETYASNKQVVCSNAISKLAT